METLLLHSNGNPRNSEGCFEKLNDGTLVFAYTRYNGSHWDDECSADICLIRSTDGGVSWSTPEIIVKNKKQNVMSVSLLRLQDGRMGMVYLEKSMICDTGWIDCRPWFTASSDEMKSWSEVVDIASVPAVYLCVLNNALVQLGNGRLICPGSFHRHKKNPKSYGRGIGLFFYSDDGGATWEQTPECCYPPQWSHSGLQEPGVVELKEDQLMAWFRTGNGCQYKSFSYDGGMSWSEVVPATDFRSPASPMTLKRNPADGNLYAVWNDYHPARSVNFDLALTRGSGQGIWTGGRTPLVLARSTDNGKTWVNHTILENAPDHGFGYTAMFFNGDDLLLAYCCGGAPDCQNMLQDLKIKIVKWKELA